MGPQRLVTFVISALEMFLLTYLLTYSGQITTFYLQTCGGVLSTVVTEGRRYGPCQLSDNNNSARMCHLIW